MTKRQKHAAIIRINRKIRRTVSRTFTATSPELILDLAQRMVHLSIQSRIVRGAPTYKTGGVVRSMAQITLKESGEVEAIINRIKRN